MKCPSGTSSRQPAGAALSAGLKVATFALGCFWGAERRSGNSLASTPRRSATPLARRRTPPTRKCAPASRGTRGRPVVFDRRPVLRRPAAGLSGVARPDQGMRQGKRRRHAVPSGIYWHDELQRQAALTSRERYQRALCSGPWRHHDRDPGGPGLLLCRGLPPAVPGEGPVLLRPRGTGVECTRVGRGLSESTWYHLSL